MPPRPSTTTRLIFTTLASLAAIPAARAQTCPGGTYVHDSWDGQRLGQAMAAAAGDSYVVAWNDGDSTRTAQVGADGRVLATHTLAPGALPLSIGQPRLVSGDGAVLAYGQRAGDLSPPTAQLVDPTGALRGGPIALDAPGGGAPDAVNASFDGHDFILTWETTSDLDFDVWMSRIDPQGGLVDAVPIHVASTSYGATYWSGSVHVGDVEWVVFPDHDGVSGVRVRDDGTVVDAAPITLLPRDGNGTIASMRATASLGDEALLLSDLWPGGGYLRTARLGPDGLIPTSVLQIQTPATGYFVGLEASPDHTHYLLTMYGNARTVVDRLAPTGALDGAPLIQVDVANADTNATGRPATAVSGDQILVASVFEIDGTASGSSNLHARRYTSTGAPLGDTVTGSESLVHDHVENCEDDGDESDSGCSAGGGRPGSMAMIGIALLAMRRRRRGRAASPTS